MQIEIDTVLHCMLMWQQISSSGLEEMWSNEYEELKTQRYGQYQSLARLWVELSDKRLSVEIFARNFHILCKQSMNREAHVIRNFPLKRPEICPWEIFVPACAIPSRNFIIILFQRHKNIFTTKPQKNNKEQQQQQKKTRFILQRRNFSNFKTLT